MNSQDFAAIFYSNYRPNIDWQNIDEITWMYAENLFTMTKIKAATNLQFLKKIDFVAKPLSGFIKNGESAAHMALKSIATDYLTQKLKIDSKDILYEFSLAGFEIDVVEKNQHFLCECGDTNAAKLEKYLSLTDTKSFLIFPYPHQKDVFLYQFQSCPNFYEYMEFKKKYHSQMIQKLRNF